MLGNKKLELVRTALGDHQVQISSFAEGKSQKEIALPKVTSLANSFTCVYSRWRVLDFLFSLALFPTLKKNGIEQHLFLMRGAENKNISYVTGIRLSHAAPLSAVGTGR